MAALRTITFTATVDSVTPTAAQFAGVQGDDSVTNVVFSLDSALVSTSYVYRVEFVDGMNNFDTTENMTITSGQTTITIPLIEAWTQAGGTGEIRLVISQVDESDSVTATLYTLVAHVYFQSKAGVDAQESELKKGLTTLISSTSTAKTAAVTAALNATSAYNLLNIKYQEPVASYSDILTTYTAPEIGWAVQVIGADADGVVGKQYRYDGTSWEYFNLTNPTLYAAMLTTFTDQLTGIANGSFIQKKDKEQLTSLIENNNGVKIAILGDSTEAGVGARGSVYGELGDKTQPTGHELFAQNLMFSSPYFLPFDNSVYTTNKPLDGYAFQTLPWISLQLIKSYAPNITYTYDHKPTKRNKLTIVYLKRYADAAATFDVTTNGTTTTIDTYKAVQSFGTVTGQTQQGMDIAYAEISISTSSSTFSFQINNVVTVDRGSGVSTDGSAVIIGFYYGSALEFKNLAVSSTTLLNSSEANVSRGITTDERLQAAYDYGANVFIIGWGTNDSKTGISTVSAYKADLITRISEIRTQAPTAIIILSGDPQGYTGSIYANNIEFYNAMKEVAITNKCSFFDTNSLLGSFTRTDIIADEIHPNQYGYNIIGYGFSNEFGLAAYEKSMGSLNSEKRLQVLENSLSEIDGFSSLRYFEHEVLQQLSSIVTASTNILRVAFFDVSSGTSVKDRSANASNITLSNDASALTPTNLGVLKTLTFGSSDTWQFADASDLSFGNGSGTDSAFSLVWCGKLPTSPTGYLIAKRDATSGSISPEYQLIFGSTNNGFTIALFNSDATAYIGRATGATPATSTLTTVVTTYDATKVSSGIKIYVNGVQADTLNFASGTYSGMTAGTAPIGNFRVNGTGKENICANTCGFVSVISEALSSSQVKSIDKLLRSSFGIDGAAVLS